MENLQGELIYPHLKQDFQGVSQINLINKIDFLSQQKNLLNNYIEFIM